MEPAFGIAYQDLKNKKDGYLKLGPGNIWCGGNINGRISIGDFNGDGKDDIWCNYNGDNYFMISTGNNFIPISSLKSAEENTNPKSVTEIALNDYESLKIQIAHMTAHLKKVSEEFHQFKHHVCNSGDFDCNNLLGETIDNQI